MLARTPLRWSQGQWARSRLALVRARSERNPRQRPLSTFRYDSNYRTPETHDFLTVRWRPRPPQSRSRNGRSLMLETIQAILTPPLVFVGLLITLWTYKCMMMVLFQDKIIYMPGMPPFARSEKIEEYSKECRPVEWEEKRIKSLDGTKISLCIGRIPRTNDNRSSEAAITVDAEREMLSSVTFRAMAAHCLHGCRSYQVC